MAPTPTVAALRRLLRSHAKRADGEFFQRYFKTGKGEYAEGDRFLGVRAQPMRAVARAGRGLPVGKLLPLLRSKWHEERLLALLVLVDAHERGEEKEQDAILRVYLANTRYINNWDLVDLSAPEIVGPHIDPSRPTLLVKLAKSKSLWERRIAMLATHWLIRRKRELRPTFVLAEMLLGDKHDLIHKAAGWMLREAGKVDRAALERFLAKHAGTMPRTMLRYAIERLPPADRKRYMSLGRTVA